MPWLGARQWQACIGSGHASDNKGVVQNSGTRKLVHLCCAGEATRLQQYEVQVLGSSSTGYKPSSASSQSAASGGNGPPAQFTMQQPAFNWAWR
jgi:hypothetical protein